ncbi:HNH endonuclease [compost metagenome]
MNTHVNANYILRSAVNRKWPADNQKEWWYMKLADVRRQKLLRCSEQQNHRCCYCGVRTWHPNYGETGSKRRLATLEHVVARAEGGTDNMNNLAMACSRCNNGRGDHFEAMEFYEMTVGLRPQRARTRTEVSAEKVAERKAKQQARSQTATVYAAYTLSALDLWWWWDAWLTYGESMLETA